MKKSNSRIPLLTVSDKYLIKRELLDNVIYVSCNNFSQNKASYEVISCGKNINGSTLDLISLKNQCIIIVCDLNDWFDIITTNSKLLILSLSPSFRKDNLVVLMIGTYSHLKFKEDLWDKAFLDLVKRRNCTVKGDGTKHGGSTGNYYGLEWIRKYDISNLASYGKVTNNNISSEEDNYVYVKVVPPTSEICVQT